jgi:hypothetical protein
MKAKLKMKWPNGGEIEWTEETGFVLKPETPAAFQLNVVLTNDLKEAAYLSHLHKVEVVKRVVESLLPGAVVVEMTGAEVPMSEPPEGGVA